jgi:hypothetical protein
LYSFEDHKELDLTLSDITFFVTKKEIAEDAVDSDKSGCARFDDLVAMPLMFTEFQHVFFFCTYLTILASTTAARVRSRV